MTAGQAGDDDLLSELLQPIRLSGVFRSWWSLTAPWAIEGDSESTCAILHYVAEGSCWVTAEGEPPVLLRTHDLAIFPTGTAHRLSDHPDRAGIPLRILIGDREPGSSEQLVHGGDGPLSRILCAGLHFDASAASSLYRALPWIMVLDRERLEQEPLLRNMIDLLAASQGADAPGSRVITLRAFEMAFVLSLRPLLSTMTERPDVLTALRHPGVSRALLIMYTRFAEPWTIESLAREAAMSRSAFTARFRELVGEAPARHLTSHRMRESARLLAESSIPQSALPAAVGYRSAVGFHLAFRKHFRMTPGEYRQAVHGRTGRAPAAFLDDC